MTCWTCTFTHQTWNEFKNGGGETVGFSDPNRATAEKIRLGDLLVCYITRSCSFVAVLRVASQPFFSRTPPIWKDDFPSRIKVVPITEVGIADAVPIDELRDRLSYFQNNENTKGWMGQFRGSPRRWNSKDTDLVLEALSNIPEAEIPEIEAGEVEVVERSAGSIFFPVVCATAIAATVILAYRTTFGNK